MGWCTPFHAYAYLCIALWSTCVFHLCPNVITTMATIRLQIDYARGVGCVPVHFLMWTLHSCMNIFCHCDIFQFMTPQDKASEDILRHLHWLVLFALVHTGLRQRTARARVLETSCVWNRLCSIIFTRTWSNWHLVLRGTLGLACFVLGSMLVSLWLYWCADFEIDPGELWNSRSCSGGMAFLPVGRSSGIVHFMLPLLRRRGFLQCICVCFCFCVDCWKFCFSANVSEG